MINVIVPIQKNATDFYDILEDLGGIKDVSVFVGVCESEYEGIVNLLNGVNNVEIHCYANENNREEIINALQGYIDKGDIMIMRKPITFDEFKKFVAKKDDVVTCEQEMGKFKTFILSLWQKILKLFLGVKLYQGDTSVVYFKEEIAMVVGQSGNLSYSSRVDRWKGLEQSTIKTKAQSVTTESDKKKNIYYLVGAFLAIVIAVGVTTLVCLFSQMSIIIGLLVACLDILALSIAIILGVMTAFNRMVGKIKFNIAFEIDKTIKTEDEE